MLLVNYTVKEQRLGGSFQEKSKYTFSRRVFGLLFKAYSKGFRNKLSNHNPLPGSLLRRDGEFLAGGGRIILSSLRPFSFEERKCKQIYIEKRRLYTLNMGVQQKALPGIKKPYLKLNPRWVTGFAYGEGCFTINILKNNQIKLGWYVKLCFTISLHVKDKVLLEEIQNYLGVGSIFKLGPESYQLIIQSIKELKLIINHFDKYYLITQKRADFELFKQAFILIQNKEHLTLEGLQKIIAIKASMNWRLSSNLVLAFPDITPCGRLLVKDQNIKDRHWLAVFTSGDGCFIVRVKKSSTYRLGIQVELMFKVT